MTASAPVNLNTATPQQLLQLPGMGPALAERIIVARPFASPRDLIRVQGIGPKLYARWLPLVTVEVAGPVATAIPAEPPETAARIEPRPAGWAAPSRPLTPAAPRVAPEPAPAEPARPSTPPPEREKPRPAPAPSPMRLLDQQGKPVLKQGLYSNPRQTNQYGLSYKQRRQMVLMGFYAVMCFLLASLGGLMYAWYQTAPTEIAAQPTTTTVPVLVAVVSDTPHAAVLTPVVYATAGTATPVAVSTTPVPVDTATAAVTETKPASATAEPFTATRAPTRTLTPLPPSTSTTAATNTLLPPTRTAVATNTRIPPTAAPTNTLVPPTRTAAATNTRVPPTVAPTNTAVPPTRTAAPTNTLVPPTRTAAATNTQVPPTVAPTNTAVPPTRTATAAPTNTLIPPTPTATAAATNTAVPAPTATPPVAAPPGAGALLYAENFDPPTYYWGVGNTNFSSTRIKEGALEIKVVRAALSYVVGGMDAQKDFIYQVTARPGDCLEGDHYGLRLRAPDDPNYYIFGVLCEGGVRVGRLINGQYTLLASQPANPAIQTGTGAVNVLRVSAIGDTFEFYANDTLLVTITDASLKQGRFGVYAKSTRTPELTVRFDDILIWAPK